jgi:hypothetical protein
MSILVLLVPQFLFIDELKQELAANSVFQTLLEKYQKDPSSLPDFKWVDGLLLFKGHIWISPHSRFKQ